MIKAWLRLTDAAFQPRYKLEQMAGILRESGAKLCELIRETLPLARPAAREEILAVIEAKGMDPNCSLQLIADHFGMSVSNFSHHFKKEMGQNFKEYLDRLRIQTFIQLLRESEEPLESPPKRVSPILRALSAPSKKRRDYSPDNTATPTRAESQTVAVGNSQALPTATAGSRGSYFFVLEASHSINVVFFPLITLETSLLYT